MRHQLQIACRRPLALASLALGLVACDGVTDALLEVEDPDIINPGQIGSEEGALGLANGAAAAFRGITGGNESTWLFGGLLADEWSTSSTFPQNDETDQRRVQVNNSQVNAMMYRLYRARTYAGQAITALNQYAATTQRPVIADMYLARGFAEMQLALDFCNGTPLSEFVDGVGVDGEPLTNAQVFARAAQNMDSALAFGNGTDARSLLVSRAARIVKGRILMALGQYQQAAAVVGSPSIPSSFVYQHVFSLTGGTNTIWGQGLSARRYSIGDSLEGNNRDILVRNALPFVTSRDPRINATVSTSINGQDGQTRPRTTTMWGQTTPVDVVNYVDAQLILAEAALARGTAADITQWLSILNALRAAPPKLGELTPTGLAPLTDPGNTQARVSLMFREKAFWTFSRGQRLGDLRRLVRQYGRTVDNVFPQGVHYKGGIYGPDINFPVVQNEIGNNQKVTQSCIDRNA
jgi:hypothetical protein